jgi:hypothetical protein
MMPITAHVPSILRMATHAHASHGQLSRFARTLLFNLALAGVLERLRRPLAPIADAAAGTPHRGFVRGLGRALLSEGVELAMLDVRWQRRRVAAAVDRAAAAASVSAHPVRVPAASSIPAQRRSGDRKPVSPARSMSTRR